MTTPKLDTIFQEEACIIEAGEHSFARHKSIINYEYAIAPKISAIANALEKGLFESMEDASPELIKKIQDGAKISEALPEKYKKFFGLF